MQFKSVFVFATALLMSGNTLAAAVPTNEELAAREALPELEMRMAEAYGALLSARAIINPGDRTGCQSDKDCPAGHSCVVGVCISKGGQIAQPNKGGKKGKGGK